MKGFLKFGVAIFMTAAIIVQAGCAAASPSHPSVSEQSTVDMSAITFPDIPLDMSLYSGMHPDVLKSISSTECADRRYTFDMGDTAYAFYEHRSGSSTAQRTDVYRVDKSTGEYRQVYQTVIPINQYMQPVSTADHIFWEESDYTAGTAVLKILSTNGDHVNELYSCGIHSEERWYELYSLPEVGENVIGLRYKNYILIYNADSKGALKLPFIPFE